MTMYDVVVYLSSLPRIADRGRKVEVLNSFAKGAQSQHARILVQTQPVVVDCRLAVILGWVGTQIKGPHIQLRRNVIDHQQQSGQHIMPIDSSCFKFADAGSMFLRYSLGGVFYNKNNYANTNSDDAKWSHIQRTLNIGMQSWRSNGQHVLLCLQRDGGWSMKGVDLDSWVADKITQLRTYTDRPILVRPHPKTKIDPGKFNRFANVQFSQNTTLAQDLANAWASVFYNSSSSVAAVLAGIPTFADDDDCVSWSVSNHDISMIEHPNMPDRQQWICDLSAAHWTDHESQSGQIYKKFLQFI